MHATDRRGLFGLALAAALAPSLAARAQSAGPAETLISPPAGPMVYRRSVTRELAGDAAITATRSFAVSFTRFSGGFMLGGRQVAVSVEGPPEVDSLLALERQRVEDGLFPIALDPLGRILSREGAAAAAPALDQALAATMRDLAAQPAATDQREELRRFVVTLQLTGQRLTAHLPVDLFAPEARPRTEEQVLALPAGGEGRVYTLFAGTRDPASGLMRSARREVVTEMAGQRRGTFEAWSLAPA